MNPPTASVDPAAFLASMAETTEEIAEWTLDDRGAGFEFPVASRSGDEDDAAAGAGRPTSHTSFGTAPEHSRPNAGPANSNAIARMKKAIPAVLPKRGFTLG